MQTERVRFTISVDEEVHQAFSDMATMAGVSLSRCVGDWLRDTSEAAHLTTNRMQEVRQSPLQDLEALAGGHMTPDLLRIMVGGPTAAETRRGRTPLAGGAAMRADGMKLSPPPSNTGGKVPQKPIKAPAKKAKGN